MEEFQIVQKRLRSPVSDRPADILSPITDQVLPPKIMFDPFTNELPEYGFVIQGFWNNANQHVVEDLFGTVNKRPSVSSTWNPQAVVRVPNPGAGLPQRSLQ